MGSCLCFGGQEGGCGPRDRGSGTGGRGQPGGGICGGCGRNGGVPGAGVRGVSGGVPGAGVRGIPTYAAPPGCPMGGTPCVGVRGVAVELAGPEVNVAGLARAAADPPTQCWLCDPRNLQLKAPWGERGGSAPGRGRERNAGEVARGRALALLHAAACEHAVLKRVTASLGVGTGGMTGISTAGPV